jgi:hypothetical protein
MDKHEIADIWFCITVAICTALFIGGVLLWLW